MGIRHLTIKYFMKRVLVLWERNKTLQRELDTCNNLLESSYNDRGDIAEITVTAFQREQKMWKEYKELRSCIQTASSGDEVSHEAIQLAIDIINKHIRMEK